MEQPGDSSPSAVESSKLDPDGLDLDYVLDELRAARRLDESILIDLFLKLLELLAEEPNTLYVQSPVVIVGDIHGQLYDLFRLFEVGEADAHDLNGKKFLFMGDYVDRGYYSIETLAYLAALKVKQPDRVFLLRGNHECRAVNQMYGFFNESVYYYGHPGIWALANDLFDMLPVAAVIDSNVFSVHGGLSPQIGLVEKISTLQTHHELPETGPLCDLAWSDPEDMQADRGWMQNPRGAGYLFGQGPTAKFLRLNKLDFMTRSHQLAQEGYTWHFQGLLCCVWSAPNYMYRSGNKASIMLYTAAEGAKSELRVFEPMPDERRKKPDDPVPQVYFA